MSTAPEHSPADPHAAVRRKLAHLLALGGLRAAAGKGRASEPAVSGEAAAGEVPIGAVSDDGDEHGGQPSSLRGRSPRPR